MNTTTHSSNQQPHQSQSNVYKRRYKVELMTSTMLMPEDNILTKELLAKNCEDAIRLAIELLQKEFPTTPWTKIEPWFVEQVSDMTAEFKL